MKVILKNGAETAFDKTEIEYSLASACAEVPEDRLRRVELEQIAGRVEARCALLGRAVSVGEIQDMVVEELGRSGHHILASHCTRAWEKGHRTAEGGHLT